MKQSLMAKWAIWLKKNLFHTPINCIISIIFITLIFIFLSKIIDWLFINSVWDGDSAVCREASGACLSFIKDKFNFIIFGFYPRELYFRPILSMLVFFSLIFYSKSPKRWNRKLIFKWIIGVIIIAILMRGGIFYLSPVEASKWGGLPLTLLLSFVGFLFSYPLGILLALGRTGNLKLVSKFCVLYIELIRGVPMISLLFMSSVILPLFLPSGMVIEKLLRAQIAIILFISAYLAEVVRGGLNSIDKGQYEAADALGFNYFNKMALIILPQALKTVIPPTVNTVIGMFKDTSLVLIIALFDLLMTTKTSLTDSNWLGFSLEAYVFVSIIYFIFCFSMGQYSRNLEVYLSKGEKVDG